jgi:hypothetical protein
VKYKPWEGSKANVWGDEDAKQTNICSAWETYLSQLAAGGGSFPDKLLRNLLRLKKNSLSATQCTALVGICWHK